MLPGLGPLLFLAWAEVAARSGSGTFGTDSSPVWYLLYSNSRPGASRESVMVGNRGPVVDFLFPPLPSRLPSSPIVLFLSRCFPLAHLHCFFQVINKHNHYLISSEIRRELMPIMQRLAKDKDKAAKTGKSKGKGN